MAASQEIDQTGSGKTPQEEAKYYTVFNFFESIPPPPDFGSFEDGFKYVVDTVKTHEQFICGSLQINLDPDGIYPYLNQAVFNTSEHGAFRRDDAWIEVIRKGHGTEQVCHPAGFEEFAYVTALENDSIHRTPTTEDTVYLVTSYRIDEDVDLEELEKNWREWSGADLMLKSQVCSNFGLHSVVLYKKFTPFGPFQYVSRAEFTSLTSTQVQQSLTVIDDIVHRLKATAGIHPHTSLFAPHFNY